MQIQSAYKHRALCRLRGPLENPTIVVHVHITKVLVPRLFLEINVEGVFSGYFYIDPEASSNGSSFTITVTDTNPHFYYMVRDWYNNCSFFGNWTSIYGLNQNQDIFFALNAVLPSKLEALMD
jgi:hypothetical protein